MLGSYYGQPPQRPKGSRRRVTFLCDRYMYDRVKEDARERNISIGSWLEQAIAHQMHSIGDLTYIEELLETKLLEILMHRNAARRGKDSIDIK